jgi:hypothetical protein
VPTADHARPVGGGAGGRERGAEAAEDRDAVPLVLLDERLALVHQPGQLTVDREDAFAQVVERLTVGIHDGLPPPLSAL